MFLFLSHGKICQVVGNCVALQWCILFSNFKNLSVLLNFINLTVLLKSRYKICFSL